LIDIPSMPMEPMMKCPETKVSHRLRRRGALLAGVAGVVVAALSAACGDSMSQHPIDMLHAEDAHAAPASRAASASATDATDARSDWSNVPRAPDVAPLSIGAYERD
jgi:hypothetical protein